MGLKEALNTAGIARFRLTRKLIVCLHQISCEALNHFTLVLQGRCAATPEVHSLNPARVDIFILSHLLICLSEPLSHSVPLERNVFMLIG